MNSNMNGLLYTDRKKIYGGPFCDVYKCNSPSGDVVALKVVDLDFLRKPHHFRREIKFLLRLSHPNIAQFVDSFAQGEDHYMVMKYYEVDLNKVLDHFTTKKIKFNLTDPSKYKVISSNGLPVSSLGCMVRSLVLALKYIHEQGIIHRDLKPANIFFPSIDHLDSPVIGDFGISYDVINPPVDEDQDHKFTDVSTGYYKAPELCFGVTDYGTEIDLWSLGILISVLYSSNGTPANYLEPDPDEIEAAPELNDFVLILGTFQAFGTPDITNRTSDLYWEKLADSKYHFVNFLYQNFPRKTTASLLPRCRDEQIVSLFESLTRYDNRLLET